MVTALDLAVQVDPKLLSAGRLFRRRKRPSLPAERCAKASRGTSPSRWCSEAMAGLPPRTRANTSAAARLARCRSVREPCEGAAPPHGSGCGMRTASKGPGPFGPGLTQMYGIDRLRFDVTIKERLG